MSEYQDAVLGAMLQDNDLYHRAGLLPIHFADNRARRAYDAMRAVIEAGEPANIVTVGRMLDVQDAPWLAGLTDLPGGSSESYIKRVKEEAVHYWLWRLSTEAKERLEMGETSETVQNFLEDGLTKIATHGQDEVRYFGDGVSSFVEELERRYQMFGSDEIPGITTGMLSLDLDFGGFESGKLYYIGARPSKGKSALLLNFLVAAARRGRKGGLITLESSEREAYARVFSQLESIPNQSLRTGNIGNHMPKIASASMAVEKWPVWICDNPDLSVSQVRMVARKMVVVHHVEALYVDYLQYIRADKEDEERRDHVAATSRALKALARRLDVPVICAAQLRRDADGRWPHLGDFAESSQVEKDADVAMLIHEEQDAGEVKTWIDVAKNRDGATRKRLVEFEKDFARFRGNPVDASREPW